jgi:hypothetical protein
MGDGNKKRMIQILSNCLKNVYGELVLVCEEIDQLAPDEYNNLEEVRESVETCVAMVAGHLEARAEEGTSSGSIASEWVRKHAVGQYELSSDGAGSHGTGEGNVEEQNTVELSDTSVSGENPSINLSTLEPIFRSSASEDPILTDQLDISGNLSISMRESKFIPPTPPITNEILAGAAVTSYQSVVQANKSDDLSDELDKTLVFENGLSGNQMETAATLDIQNNTMVDIQTSNMDNQNINGEKISTQILEKPMVLNERPGKHDSPLFNSFTSDAPGKEDITVPTGGMDYCPSVEGIVSTPNYNGLYSENHFNPLERNITLTDEGGGSQLRDSQLCLLGTGGDKPPSVRSRITGKPFSGGKVEEIFNSTEIPFQHQSHRDSLVNSEKQEITTFSAAPGANNLLSSLFSGGSQESVTQSIFSAPNIAQHLQWRDNINLDDSLETVFNIGLNHDYSLNGNPNGIGWKGENQQYVQQGLECVRNTLFNSQNVLPPSGSV